MPLTLKPIDNDETASWGLSISSSDFQKLKNGFSPMSMDDKWVIKAMEPDQNGNITVHYARSWTGAQFYILTLRPADDNSAVVETITWRRGANTSATTSSKQARKESVILSRMLLGCRFESLPQYNSSIFWNPQDDESDD
ncbi:unnamed protein product [Clonostachys rhizophaga]|uniref:Uncharacterized protein n=1 Tax=Clonostachys rhizophaga TaxID=160324 RepID=A0A9N9YFK6_9HYPO|nr:unnamed protein product [Clonostachys rhizophaga]